MVRDQPLRAFLAVVAAASALWPTATRGESGPRPVCYEQAIFAPAANTTIPANAPVLLFRSPSLPYQTHPLADFQIEVRALSTGGIISLESYPDPDDAAGRTHLFRLSTSLVPGPYQWAYIDYCMGLYPATPTAATVPFTVGPEVPLPVTIGSIAAPEAHVLLGGECTGSVSVETRLELVPSPDMAAYLPVSRFMVTVLNTGNVHQYGYGEPRGTNPIVFWVSTPCSPSGLVFGQRIPAGLNQVEIQAHVAGAAVDPTPLVLDVLVECPGPDVIPPCVPDAGTDSVMPVPGDAAGGAATSGSGGCAIGSPMDAPSGRVAALLIVLATVRRGWRSR